MFGNLIIVYFLTISKVAKTRKPYTAYLDLNELAF